MDEQLQQEVTIEQDERERDERDKQRAPTQRELVRASLLRCPPAAAGDEPRH